MTIWNDPQRIEQCERCGFKAKTIDGLRCPECCAWMRGCPVEKEESLTARDCLKVFGCCGGPLVVLAALGGLGTLLGWWL